LAEPSEGDEQPPVEGDRPEVVEAAEGTEGKAEASPTEAEASPTEAVASPAKVLRIGAMTKELLEEVRRAPVDEAGRARLRDIYATSVTELSDGLSDDLKAELARLSSPFDASTPTEAELRVAQAQLVGWLEGLFHGIQAALFAQQMDARAQLEEMQRRGLPPGPDPTERRPGTYL